MTDTEKFLTGQTALITGGASGIGAACAIELARRGANTAINYLHSHDQAEEVAQQCRDFGVRSEIIQADVSKEQEVDDMYSAVLDQFQKLHILIANAGIQKDAPFVDMSFDQWQKVLAVNLTGQFLCAQKAVGIFCSQGIDSSVSMSAGKIVHISSVHDEIPWAGHTNYAASKGGIKMLMESAALELAAQKIRINSVSPGAIKTRINRPVWSDQKRAEKLLKLIPYGRIGEVEDVARPVAWLTSDAADYITGTTLYIDGGMTLYPGFYENG